MYMSVYGKIFIYIYTLIYIYTCTYTYPASAWAELLPCARGYFGNIDPFQLSLIIFYVIVVILFGFVTASRSSLGRDPIWKVVYWKNTLFALLPSAHAIRQLFHSKNRCFLPGIHSENPWGTWVFKHFFRKSTKIKSYGRAACPTSFRENMKLGLS